MKLRQPEIINHPHLQPMAQRTLYSLVTLAAWSLWVYLFLPLISLGAWYLGIEWFGRYLLGPTADRYLWSLALYAAVIAGLGLSIVAWSRYNHWRFGTRRRRPPPPIPAVMLRERFVVGERDLEAIHAASVMTLHLDEHGQVVRVDVNEPLRAAEPISMLG